MPGDLAGYMDTVADAIFSTIRFASVPDAHHPQDFASVIDFVEDAVTPNTNAVILSRAFELPRTGRSRIMG